MRMPKAGRFDVQFDGELIVALGHGPWNHNGISGYFESIRSVHRAQYVKAKGILALLQGDCLLTPEAENTFKAMMEWREDSNSGLPVAVVFVETIHTGMIKRYIEKLYNRFGIKHQFFDVEADARLWLASPEAQ